MLNIAFSVVVFILVFLILVCVALIIASLARPNLDGESLPPCERVEIFTPKEQSFFIDIKGICEKLGFVPFAKVGMGCILKPRKKVSNRGAWSKYIRSEYADFVLCDPQTMNTLLVIMLDDNGLSLQKSKIGTVDKACEMAEIPVLHVREYNITGLEKAINQKISSRRKVSSKANAIKTPQAGASREEAATITT